jgi:glyoxylase-like metal-dependent hydrolase (beta-lactamase superfamily II)
MVSHVTDASAALLDELPGWVRLVRAPNPGMMTLDGTNTWILRAPGADRCVVVDPGPLIEPHLLAITDHAPVGSIFITHRHPDHVEGAARLAQLLGGVPVVAADPQHCDRTAPIDADVDLDQSGLAIRALVTPGHSSDSVCFVVDADADRAVLTGDTILGRGTTVVAHPDGNLGDYLDSLRRLRDLGGLPVLPGHGPALADCGVAAEFYLQHRLARLDQVRAALAGGAKTAADVVAAVYADVDRSLWWAAEMSVSAQLAYLGDRESEDPSARLDRP